MFALIRREIRDHAVFFMGAVVLSGILVGLSIPVMANHRRADKYVGTRASTDETFMSRDPVAALD